MAAARFWVPVVVSSSWLLGLSVLYGNQPVLTRGYDTRPSAGAVYDVELQ